jgi:dephospho-CoA kinase
MVRTRTAKNKIMLSFKDFISESIEDKGKLKAVFLAGSPGAGKTYTISKIADGSIQPRVVNTDIFFEFLTNKFKMPVDTVKDANNAWSFIQDKSKLLTKNSLSNYLNSMLPLIIDGTSSNPNNLLMRVGILESLGYDVSMAYVKTDLETAIKRVQSRNRKVDEEFIRHAFEEMQKAESFYKDKFGTFIEIPNGDGELNDAAVTKAFKKMRGFFGEDVKNPVGRKIVDEMKQDRAKYLVPTIIDKSELDKKVEMWYRK